LDAKDTSSAFRRTVVMKIFSFNLSTVSDGITSKSKESPSNVYTEILKGIDRSRRDSRTLAVPEGRPSS
jgi:hypothetical protein